MAFITRRFRVRVGEGRNAYFFTIRQDEWSNLFVEEIDTPLGPIQRSISLPENVVLAMCDALEIVRSGQGCVDPILTGSTGVTGITGVTGNVACTGFTFI